MTSRLLLMLGPSGVGKTTIIRELLRRDSRFLYPSPFMTRELRANEMDKVVVSGAQLDELWERGELLAVNEMYGVRYGTPKKVIVDALASGKFPILDWPIQFLELSERVFGHKPFRVFIEPPSLEHLRHRMGDRRGQGQRWESALEELERLGRGDFDDWLDLRVVNDEEKSNQCVDLICSRYLQAISDGMAENLKDLSGG